MSGRNIRFNFQEKDYTELCLGCDDALFRAISASTIFTLGKNGYLYVQTNDVAEKSTEKAKLMYRNVQNDNDPQGQVGYIPKFIFDIKVPEEDFDDIVTSAYGFDYNIL
ncbi:hypothetical protein [Wolbachia endosymbiont of Folsomia candida]|uniref:hypothetical protein n=1 Tax=Wolbachia endosymbiont of Folsomia candida TaxID=169402 RepID=UPI000AA574FF|nr:hypothetical protein [Wolbachia endosymbiont of Folsomia candida]APR98115.1 hypothetical protein ASM33_02260 [Wolbachia endosymbiont of Folsomia candida]